MCKYLNQRHCCWKNYVTGVMVRCGRQPFKGRENHMFGVVGDHGKHCEHIEVIAILKCS